MTSFKRPLLIVLPVMLAACSFDAPGLGSAGGGGSESASTTSVDASTDATAQPGTTTDPGGSATDSPTTTTTTTTTDAAATTDPGGTTDMPSICGDGVVQMPQEQCDAGAMNGDDQACTDDCQHNICGDGKQGPGEGCDDGNLRPGDGCDEKCVSEDCGDGVKQPNEACDDGNQIDDDGCTNACTLPKCGDKIVQPPEDCDDGVESITCNANCSNAKCGDGIVNMAAGQECDDENTVNTDACTNACKLAKCGDGFVQGDEQCDDGNMVNDDACDNMCKVVGLRAFVSSATYKGNLGGLSGADEKCNALATAEGLGGQWMAWLSDGETGPAQRFTTKGGPKPYIRLDGKLIATNWADLIDGTLTNPINITEKNVTPGGQSRVWTNTQPNGTLKDNSNDKHCQSWGSDSNSNSNEGFFGLRAATDNKWTDESSVKCGDSHRIYCFEQ